MSAAPAGPELVQGSSAGTRPGRSLEAALGAEAPSGAAFTGLYALLMGLALPGPLPTGSRDCGAGTHNGEIFATGEGGKGLPPAGKGLPLAPLPLPQTCASTAAASPVAGVEWATADGRALASTAAASVSDARLIATQESASGSISGTSSSSSADARLAALTAMLAAAAQRQQKPAGREALRVSEPLMDLDSIVNATPRQGGRELTVTLPVPGGERANVAEAFGQHLVRMVRSGNQDAKLQLHPAHLGSIEVQLKIDGDTAQLVVSSPQAAVRDALETAIPRLRDLLGDMGLNLTQADVQSQDSQAGDGRGANTATTHDGNLRADEADPELPTSAQRLHSIDGVIDVFA